MPKVINWIISTIFVLLELLCLFLVVFVGGELGRITSFISVILAFLTGMIFFKLTNKTFFINIAMLMTVCADFCLVILQPMEQIWGMIFFSITQTIYGLYLYLNAKSNHERNLNLILRTSLVVIMETVMFIIVRDKADIVSILSMYYISNLIINIVFSFWKGNAKPLFAIGLIFFLLCDLFVGFSVAIGVYFEISSNSWLYKIIYADFNFIWLFYIISQTFITLHLITQANKKLN